MFKGLQAGNLLRLSGAKLCRPALLGACWCTAACVPSRGAATAQCSACAAFLVAAAAGAAKRVQEGLSLLLYSFVSSFQVVLCEQRCACGQVANRWVRSLSPDSGGDIDKTRTKRTCDTQSALKHLKCATLACAIPMSRRVHEGNLWHAVAVMHVASVASKRCFYFGSLPFLVADDEAELPLFICSG